MTIGELQLSYARLHAAQDLAVAPQGAAAPVFTTVSLPDGPMAETMVSDYTAILGGRSWNGVGVSDHPAIVTYSFSAGAQPYLAAYEFRADFIASFEAFSTADENLARDALAQWGAASGLIFIEAPAGEGDIQFGRFDFHEEPAMNGFHGYAFYPDVKMTPDDAREGPLGGDVFVDDGAPNRMWLMLHEIGHALGFKHPHQGDPTLAPAVDDQDHTVMSYNGDEPGILGPFDNDAVEYLYGLPGDDGTHVASWSWDEATATLTQTGTTGADTIRGVYGNDVISGAGANDLIFGTFGDDVLSGDLGQDTLFGWDDSDVLKGGRGADLMDGGDGSDRYVYAKATDSTGANHDTIAGFDALDADAVDIKGHLHSIEAAVVGGTLSQSTFDADLEAAIGGPELHRRAAVLFAPDSGTYAGVTFLIIESNGDSGYQAGGDLAIRLDDAVHLGSLDASDFV